MNFIKNILENLILKSYASPIVKKNFVFPKPKKILEKGLKEFEFGEANPDKLFYVIRRTPGAGLFSNLAFVINHLEISEKINAIPVVDMENFPTIYNENEPINGTKNCWKYYFNQISDYNLEDVYNSKNVIISNSRFSLDFEFQISKNENLKKIFNKYIKINNKMFSEYLELKKKFQNYKMLGVFFRGSSYKTSANHPFPATKKQMINLVNKFQGDFDKMFISTEELEYLDIFKKKFGDKIIYLDCYRSNKDNFSANPRNHHRYLLGKETLLDTLLLSSCDCLLSLRSNVTEAAILLNKNNNLKVYEIFNGINHSNKYIARYYWYIKKTLPSYIGGFDNKDFKINNRI